ncbi:MAG: hypothetical protein HRT87_03815 [Legionellales bacterium]|nr:hypothetical protein [Legionellales bacterium]
MSLVSHDLFLRYRSVNVDGREYPVDRGYTFEQQLHKNTGFVMDKTLGDYQQAEFDSEIPLMIYSPTIVNDGRRMIIGTQPYGFLNGTKFMKKNIGPENVELIKLFESKKF